MRFFPPAIRSVNALLLLLCFSFAPAHAQTADDRDAQLLDANQPIKRKIAGAENHYYRIMLAADQYVRLVVDQRGVDVSVTLYQPDGKIVVESNRLIGAYGPETISWVAESSGFYKLEVRSPRADQIAAEYEVRILEERTATFQDKNRIPAQKVFMQAEQLRGQQTPESLNQAIAKYEGALQSWRDIGDRSAEAQTLNVIGLVHHLLKREPLKAREHFDKALQIWQSLGDRRGEAESLNNIARVYESSGERERALDYYKRSLQPWADARERYGEAWTLFNMGRVYSFLKDSTQALDHFQRAMKLWQDLGDHSREAATLNGIGDTYFSINDYQNALSTYRRARAQWQAARDLNGERSTLYAISRTYAVLQDKTKEEEYKQLADALTLKIQQTRPTPEAQAKSDKVQLAEQAREDARRLLLQGTRESQRKAVAKNEEAVLLFESAGDYDREVFTLFDISSIYRTLGDKENERKTLDRSRSIAERVNRASLRAEALQRLAGFHFDSGDDLKAADYYERAIDLWRGQRDQRSEAYLLSSTAKVYNKLNDKEKALAYLERARKLFQDLGDRFREAYILNDIAAIQEGPEQKLEYLKRTRALRREKGDRAGEADSLKEIIAVYRSMDDKRQTLDYYHQTLNLYREIRDGMGEAFILRDLMGYWKELDQPSLAILYGKQAVNTYQGIRQNIQGLERETQTSFIRSKEDIYRDLADLLISEGRLVEAQLVLDMLKEEEFNNFIRGRKRKEPVTERANLTATENEVYRKYKEFTDEATTLSSEQDALLAKPVRTADEEKRLNDLDVVLKAANKAFRDYIAQLPKLLATPDEIEDLEKKMKRHVDLKGTLEALGSGSVALYTLVVKDKYRVILFTPRVKIARQYSIKTAELHKKVMDFRAALQDQKSDPLPYAKDLYRILIEPIAKDLVGANAKILMWSLDGSLRYVPIAALHDGEKYLVERYRNETFTPESVGSLRSSPAPSWRGLGVGVSSFSDGSDPLPAVTEELNGIFRNEDDPKANGGTFPGKIMLNEESTKDAMLAALRSRQYKLVHIATHFKLIPGDWENSYLVLGKKDKITGADMKDMTNTFGGVDLLTLSACNTGVGDANKTNGEEVDGFGQAAQEQGAAAVIATLWAVADASTGLLMQKFYQFRMRNGQPANKAESLQEAQLTFLRKQVTASDPGEKDYSHPYFWAPFILIGNWQ